MTHPLCRLMPTGGPSHASMHLTKQRQAGCQLRPMPPSFPSPARWRAHTTMHTTFTWHAQVAHHLSAVPPIQLLRPSLTPWRGGLLTLDAVVQRLRELLPPTFEELGHDFAVGVVREDGVHELIDAGPLPEAVAASAAIPVIFANVRVAYGSGEGGGQAWK